MGYELHIVSRGVFLAEDQSGSFLPFIEWGNSILTYYASPQTEGILLYLVVALKPPLVHLLLPQSMLLLAARHVVTGRAHYPALGLHGKGTWPYCSKTHIPKKFSIKGSSVWILQVTHISSLSTKTTKLQQTWNSFKFYLKYTCYILLRWCGLHS